MLFNYNFIYVSKLLQLIEEQPNTYKKDTLASFMGVVNLHIQYTNIKHIKLENSEIKDFDKNILNQYNKCETFVLKKNKLLNSDMEINCPINTTKLKIISINQNINIINLMSSTYPNLTELCIKNVISFDSINSARFPKLKILKLENFKLKDSLIISNLKLKVLSLTDIEIHGTIRFVNVTSSSADINIKIEKEYKLHLTCDELKLGENVEFDNIFDNIFNKITVKKTLLLEKCNLKEGFEEKFSRIPKINKLNRLNRLIINQPSNTINVDELIRNTTRTRTTIIINEAANIIHTEKLTKKNSKRLHINTDIHTDIII